MIKKILIFGLGNPGTKYQNTRHNLGHLIIDNLMKDKKLHLRKKKHLLSYVSECFMIKYNAKIILAKSFNYVNLSGISVNKLYMYYNIIMNNIYIIHDDIDLTPNTIKIKFGGSEGGHKGLKSISKYLNNKNYFRIRIGVGRPINKMQVSHYVLQKCNLNDLLDVDNIVKKIKCLILER